MQSAAKHLREFWATHKHRWPLVVGALVGLIVVVQLFYPRDRLLPFTTVDAISMSSWKASDAERYLDAAYRQQTIALYFGSAATPQVTTLPADVGLVAKNADRVKELGYPWYMRLVPTSVLWYGLVEQPAPPRYDRESKTLDEYMAKKLGDSCKVAPIDASLKADGDKVAATKSANGGTCELGDVRAVLAGVKPVLTTPTKLKIAMDETSPAVSDNVANDIAATINAQLAKGVAVTAGNETVQLAAKDVVSWLTATVQDKTLRVGIDAGKANDTLQKAVGAKVARSAGVTKVTTHDFVETARSEGAKGQALDVGATGDSIARYLTAEAGVVTAATRVVEPTVQYTRSYSATDTGLSALIRYYAEDHDGVYGVQFIELSGQRRRAGYNESQQFVAASTYKLFVAYGTLKKVEAGQWRWSDQAAGGRDVAACFDDMIVRSDNACAEALLERYGYSNLTRDIRALGLSAASGFIGDGPKATAGDLGLFMAMLESGQLPISPASRDRFIGALKRNVYRQGIPAGASGVVADKVGFLNGLLHDAAIVYSPSGTYVLVVMTDKSSWATIADLTKKIEELRSK